MLLVLHSEIIKDIIWLKTFFTFFMFLDSSIWLETVNLGQFIVQIKGSQVRIHFSLCRLFLSKIVQTICSTEEQIQDYWKGGSDVKRRGWGRFC